MAAASGDKAACFPYALDLPAITSASGCRLVNSDASRVFPAPASPLTMTTRARPSFRVARNSAESRSSWNSRSTNSAPTRGVALPAGNEVRGARASYATTGSDFPFARYAPRRP